MRTDQVSRVVTHAYPTHNDILRQSHEILLPSSVVGGSVGDVFIRPVFKRTLRNISEAGIRCNALESKLRLIAKTRFCPQNRDPLGSDDQIRRTRLIDKKKIGVVGDLLLRYGASFCGKFNLANPSAHNTSQPPDQHPRESPFDSASLSPSDRYSSLEPWPRAIQFPSPSPATPSTR